ncbi:unnamed protein product, partial [Rotaria sp. Silwood2]
MSDILVVDNLWIRNKNNTNLIDDLKSKIATDEKVPRSNEMNYSLDIKLNVFYFLNFILLKIVLHPVNLNFELNIAIKFAEQNFERPIYQIKYKIERMSFEIDPKQFSDLLDFIKFQNYNRCREYRQLCLKDLVGNTKLTKDEQDRIQVLESKLDVLTMAYIRHSVELETHLYSDTSAYDDYSWWSWWWNGRTNSNQDHHRIIKGTMHNEDEFFSEELLDIDAQIIMNELNFTLLSASKKRILELDFGYFRIFGLKSNQQNRPLILTSSSKSFNSLIHLEFELAPIHKKADFRFLLIMEPLTIIYHAATINEIVSHFEPIDKKTCSSTSIIKQRTFQQMENDLSNKKIFDMTMQIKGLSLLLPEYGYFKHDSKTIISRFSNLILRSCLNNNQQEQDDVLFQFLRILDKERYYTLRPIPLIDTNFYKCIYSDDSQLVEYSYSILLISWRIAVKIAKMAQVDLSRINLTKIINLNQSVPLFYSNMMETINRINLFFNIFPPHTSIESHASINKSYFVIMDPKTSIET